MPLSGAINAFFLFDVAQTIDLRSLRQALGSSASEAALADKAPGPPRLRYIQPPVVVDGRHLGCQDVGGFSVRVKFYDYGVISLALTRPFSGSWSDLVSLGQELIENEVLQQQAERACHVLTGVDRVEPSLQGQRATFLDEDYLVFTISSLDELLGSDELIARHGVDIAQLLRGERHPLSRQEREETLRHRLSYLDTDLVIPTWSAAFVLDTEAAAPGTLEILEFANSQLLEFRFHDDQLEAHLGGIYAALQRPRWTDRLIGRRHLRATHQLHSLLIDVNELTDRTENALKLVGDLYAARLFTLAAARLGLEDWKRNVQDKLETLDDVYRFAVDQTRVSQGNLLELIVVVILVIELGLSLAGILGS